MIRVAQKPRRPGPRAGSSASRYAPWHFSQFTPVESWHPAINVYRMQRRLDVCVDLAGADRKNIDVSVEPGRLTVRGSRGAPEPDRQADELTCILTMEIDHGQFCRTIDLPQHVELSRVQSQYRDGLLWISLPFRDEA